MGSMNADDFYEEDEPVEKIKGAFERGRKTVTAQPTHHVQAGQTKYIGTGLAVAAPSSSLSESRLAGQPQRG